MWILRCLMRRALRLKASPHSAHLYGFSTWWDIWCMRWEFGLKLFPYLIYLEGLSPKQSFWWLRTLPRLFSGSASFPLFSLGVFLHYLSGLCSLLLHLCWLGWWAIFLSDLASNVLCSCTSSGMSHFTFSSFSNPAWKPDIRTEFLKINHFFYIPGQSKSGRNKWCIKWLKIKIREVWSQINIIIKIPSTLLLYLVTYYMLSSS